MLMMSFIKYTYGSSPMHLTMRQLSIFEAVAEHQSYTRAAKALFLTQPAVSMQIKQLESQIG
ncbi:MAG: LysR family transcriptional regulator, partial [Mariprofundaceae bacterium]